MRKRLFFTFIISLFTHTILYGQDPSLISKSLSGRKLKESQVIEVLLSFLPKDRNIVLPPSRFLSNKEEILLALSKRDSTPLSKVQEKVFFTDELQKQTKSEHKNSSKVEQFNQALIPKIPLTLVFYKSWGGEPPKFTKRQVQLFRDRLGYVPAPPGKPKVPIPVDPCCFTFTTEVGRFYGINIDSVSQLLPEEKSK